MNAQLVEESIPQDPYQLLKFALSVEGSPARPAMNRLWDRSGGGGLSGLDAAGQAGLILGALRPLGPLTFAVLVADGWRHSRRCDCHRECCRGSFPDPHWKEAISTICHEAQLLHPVLDSSATEIALEPEGKRPAKAIHYESIVPPGTRFELIRAVTEKIFRHQGTTLRAIAVATSYSERLVQERHKAMVRWLRGSRAGANQPLQEGLVSRAWIDAATALSNAGLLEEA